MKNREKIKQKMFDKGIQVGYHYQPNHWLSYYKGDNALSFPITEKIFPELMSLPLHPDLSIDDVKYISKQLIDQVGNSNE